jgi:hypothetical protein
MAQIEVAAAQKLIGTAVKALVEKVLRLVLAVSAVDEGTAPPEMIHRVAASKVERLGEENAKGTLSRPLPAQAWAAWWGSLP